MDLAAAPARVQPASGEATGRARYVACETGPLAEAIGESWTFWLFAGMCVLAGIFVWKLVPETKGKTLAQIQQMWS